MITESMTVPRNGQCELRRTKRRGRRRRRREGGVKRGKMGEN